jgi:predicted TIM-barrel fold metal-dependent hydrolase
VIIDIHMHPPAEEKTEAFAGIIEDMDKAGVDVGVLLVTDSETVTGRGASNDFMAEVMKSYRGRFICFGSVDPHKGQIAVREVDRLIGELGLRGLKFFPSTQLFYPCDSLVYPIYEKAQELDIPVIFHSGAPLVAGTHKLKYNQPILLDEVAIDFPDLKIICGHMGNPWFMDVYTMAERHENFYFDISGRAREFLPLVPWKLFEDRISDKVLFGTDMQHSPSEYIEEIRQLPISDEFKEKILGDNAEKLLSL